MSQENVEAVREYVEAFCSTDLAPSDWSRIVADFFEPDADYYPVRKFPETRPCHGVEEITQWLAVFRDAWDRYEFAIKKLIPGVMTASSSTRRSGRRDAGAESCWTEISTCACGCATGASSGARTT